MGEFDKFLKVIYIKDKQFHKKKERIKMSQPVLNFATTTRHADIISMLCSEYISRYRDENLFKMHRSFKDTVALSIFGKRQEPESARLIDATKYETYPDISFNVLEPDFMLFRDNKYLINRKGTRVLGQPDLLVEIWSEFNDDEDRAAKLLIYSSSPITEHWYFEQDSNEVLCYLGKQKLPSQSLTKTLITQNGIEFDLSILKI